MRTSLLLISAVVATGVTSCQKTDIAGEDGNGTAAGSYINAEITDDDVRTHLNDNSFVVWDSDDEIKVIANGGTDAVYQLKRGAGTTFGYFELKAGDTAPSGSKYNAYSPVSSFDGTRTVWPEEQTYVAVADGRVSGAPMAAEANSLDDVFHFKNCGGIICLKLQLASGSKTVKSIKLTSANYSTTLDCGDGVTVGSSSTTDFYIAAPEGTYTDLQFEITASDNTIYSHKATNDIEVECSYFTNLTKTTATSDWILHQEFEWVDLGLPSGMLWASANIGASSPYDYGNYYFWGETEPWFTYSGTNVTWLNGHKVDLTHWNSVSNMKSINSGLTRYYKQYDVAYCVSGGEGMMPSSEDWNELKNNTDFSYETAPNGVKYMKFTKKNDTDKYICLPAAGYFNSSSFSSIGTYCYYHSRENNAGSNFYYMTLNQWGTLGTNFGLQRYSNALPVRPVKQGAKMTFVDLGLSVLWADMNLGATSKISNNKKSYGDYYMWGYTDNDAVEYTFNVVGNYTKWGGTWNGSGSLGIGGKYNTSDGIKSLQNEDDAAWVASNGEYRMPTFGELEELFTSTNIDKIYNSDNSITFKNKTSGNSINIPAAGRYGDNPSSGISYGASWDYFITKTLVTESSSYKYQGVCCFIFKNVGTSPTIEKVTNDCGTLLTPRYYGYTIRPVKEK